LHEIKERYNTGIDTAMIHDIFDKLTIRELTIQDEEEYWQKGKVSLRYRGLENLGNTCYINTFMQCLFMTKKFRGFVHQLTKDDSLPSSMLKTYALHNLFEELEKKEVGTQSPFRPEYFRIELPEPFNAGTVQQDSGEFGRIYL
jgi:ubiquitin C-terminal hydrolase